MRASVVRRTAGQVAELCRNALSGSFSFEASPASWRFGLELRDLQARCCHSDQDAPALSTSNTSADSPDESLETENKAFYPRKIRRAMARYILHTRYKPGQFLSKDDQRFVEDYILTFHPRKHEKIGAGIAGIKVGLIHKKGAWSQCFYVSRVDNTEEDFSYRKCRTL